MKAVILAGGKGTRLGLKSIPKSMVKINGTPLLEHQINILKKNNINDIYILSGHLSNEIIKYFDNSTKFGIKITHMTETSPLGTAGSLKRLERRIQEKFLLIYGDILFDIDIQRLIAFDKKKNGLCTIVAHPNNHPYDSDLLEINETSKIVQYYLKPHDPNLFYKNLVSSGIFIISPEIFKYLSPEHSDLMKDVIPYTPNNSYAYITPEYIFDIGTPGRLTKARRDYQNQKVQKSNLNNKQKAIFLDRDGVINKLIPDLSKIDDFELLPNVTKAIKKINESEYLAIVVTNQPAIAKGFLTETELQNIHNKMDTLLGNDGVYIDALYYCPHHPDKGFEREIPKLKMDCFCRKPNPGMLLMAADDLNIDLKNSWLIGDSIRDIIAGYKADCRCIGIGDMLDKTAYSFIDLYSAINFILKGKYE